MLRQLSHYLVHNGHSCIHHVAKKWIYGGNFRKLLRDLQTSFTDRKTIKFSNKTRIIQAHADTFKHVAAILGKVRTQICRKLQNR